MHWLLEIKVPDKTSSLDNFPDPPFVVTDQNIFLKNFLQNWNYEQGVSVLREAIDQVRPEPT